MQVVKLQYLSKRNTDAHPDILCVSAPSLHDHSYRNVKEIKQVKWNDMKRSRSVDVNWDPFIYDHIT